MGYGHAMDSIGRDNRHTWTHFGLFNFHPLFFRKCLTISKLVAERKGFEPLSPLRGCLISSQVQSTTLPSLRPIHKAHWRVLLKPIR